MKLCFTTIAYGWYQDLIPTYVLSILKSFPQHYAKIFCKEKLSNVNKQTLNLIKQKISNNFEVIDSFNDLDECKLPHDAANRFLLTRDYFEGFDYVYIGDIDFIIYNQFNDQFYDQYVLNCQKTNLPFSNSWWNDKGRFRMTGLHFIIKDPYFDAVDNQINDMKHMNSFRCLYKTNLQTPTFDEEMLYHMLSQKFDLRVLKDYRRPLHGVHLGVFRNSLEFCITDKDWSHQSECLKQLSKLDLIFKNDIFLEHYKCMGPEAKHIFKNTIFMLYRKLYL